MDNDNYTRAVFVSQHTLGSLRPSTRDTWSAFGLGETLYSPTESWRDLNSAAIAEILKYRNADINRLNNEVDALKSALAQINQQAKAMNTQVKNLYVDRLVLKEPLNILLKEEGGYFTATSLDLDLYGVGDSAQEAIKDLGENLEDMYLTFKQEGKDNLGPNMLRIWNFMSSIVKENNNATQGRRSNKSL